MPRLSRRVTSALRRSRAAARLLLVAVMLTPGMAMAQATQPTTLHDAYELAWELEADGPIAGTATVVDGTAYVGSDDKHVRAIDLATGKPKWAFATEGPVSATPLVHAGGVYVGSADGRLYALDAETGEKRWAFQTDDKVLGGALADPGDKPGVIFGSYDNRLYRVLLSGEEHWRFEAENYINATPARAADGRVIVGGCDGVLYAVRGADGKVVGQRELGGEIVAEAAIAGGKAFVGSYRGEFHATDLDTMAPVWTFRDRDFPYEGAAAVKGDRIVVGTGGRRVYCLDAGTGEKRWAFKTRGDVSGGVVISDEPGDGRVVFGSADGRLYIVDLETGEQVWSYEIGSEVTAAPAVVGDRVVVGAHDGVVYCFKAKNQ